MKGTQYMALAAPLTRKGAFLLSLMLFALLCGGCASSGWVDVASINAPPIADTAATALYQWQPTKERAVAPGYSVHVSSADPKLNGTFRVDIDNTLKLPHDKSISTAGLDEPSLQEAVRSTYRPFFKSPDELRVKVRATEPLIDVQGLVMKPGQYTIKKTASIDEIIALAGGLNEKGPTEKVKYLNISGPNGSGIVRLADYHSGLQPLAPHWQGGERLFFQTNAPNLAQIFRKDPSIVRVIGQVKAPAEYPVTPGATFFTYLLQAGGPTDRADLGNITLIRSDAAATRAKTFNGQSFRDIPPIEPGDTIIVNADVATQTERTSRVAASIASVLTSLSMLAIASL